MTSNNKSKVIIVGGGISGLTCAKLLQDAQIETVVLERSTKAGEKSFGSGIVNSNLLSEIFGNSLQYEREIKQYKNFYFKESSFQCLDFTDEELLKSKLFTVLGVKLIPQIASLTELAGTKVIYGEVVRELIVKNNYVEGVKTEKNEYYSDIVVIAEGTKGILSKFSGIRKGEIIPQEIFIFAEEMIQLPKDILETLAQQAIKIHTNSLNNDGIDGIGYINKNLNSISIGIGIPLIDSVKKGLNINDYLEEIKNQEAIRPLIANGSFCNYFSYILPKKLETSNLSNICADGCLLTGASARFVDPFCFDVSTLPIISAKYAAKAITEIYNEKKKFSKNELSRYLDYFSSHVKVKEQAVNIG